MKKLIIAALVAMGAAGAAQAETVRLATEGAYAPFNFINDDGEIDGFEREFGDKLCELAKLDCVWVKNDWDSIIPNLVSSNYDAIIAGMSITAERDEVIDFSEAYFPPDPSAYIALAGADDDVVGGNVAAQAGTIQADHVAASGATLLEFTTADDAIAAVQSGEADAALVDKSVIEPVVAESGGAVVFVGEDVMLGEGIGIGMRESDDDLEAKFNAAIQQMKEDGTLSALIYKWFDGRVVKY